MRKTVLFTYILLGLSFGNLQAQNILLYNLAGDTINGLSDTIYGYSMDNLLTAYVNVENKSGGVMTVNLKRYEISVTPGTQNYFCWGQCYTEQNAGDSVLWISVHDVDMDPDSAYKNFSGYHKPMMQSGNSVYRYVWYDVNNTNDSSYADLVFKIANNTSIDEPKVINALKAWPNPASSGISVSYDLGGVSNDGKLVISNMLGKTMDEIVLKKDQGVLKLDLERYTPGVYFYAIRINENTVSTKKLIVTE